MSETWNIHGTSEQTPGGSEQIPFVAVEAAAETQEATANATAQASSAGPAYAAGPAGAPPVGSWGSVGSVGPGYLPPPPPPVGAFGAPSDANPAAAFWLGLIPGVGAMYNGQVAKGFVHLIVFAVLVSMANAVNGLFGLFIAGWIFFMAFEAYHTAKARREGLPLPNAFGWNDIGERMGLGRNWPFSPGVPVSSAGAAPASQTTAASADGWTGVPPVSPVSSVSSVSQASPMYPVSPVPPVGAVGYGGSPNWAGYVPPTAFPTTPAGPTAGAAVPPPGHGVPYAPVHTGDPYTGAPLGTELPPTPSRLPVGAIWLIGLGVLFLLSQWTPLLQVSRVWIPSILLAGLAAFLFARRMGWTGVSSWQTASVMPMELRLAGAVRVPGILLTIAILNGLHEAWIVRWDHSWPWLLIATGVLLLVERVALRRAADLPPAGDTAEKVGL